MFESFLTFNNFLTALRSVPTGQVLLELLVIGSVVYWVIRFLQGTRGARLLKGIVFLLITVYLSVRLLGALIDLGRLEILFDRFLFYASFAVIIVFQPELRRALMRLGETRLFRGMSQTGADEAEQVVEACAFLSRRRVGALIAIERDVSLGSFAEDATRLDAEVSGPLIQTIFWPNTALHDLGMIISNGRIAYAGVQFPLAESGDLPKELGSRHRAGVGLSAETDALVVIVSEETGDISIAERGKLYRRRSVEQLRNDLAERMIHGGSLGLDDEQQRPRTVAPSPASAARRPRGDTAAPAKVPAPQASREPRPMTVVAADAETSREVPREAPREPVVPQQEVA